MGVCAAGTAAGDGNATGSTTGTRLLPVTANHALLCG